MYIYFVAPPASAAPASSHPSGQGTWRNVPASIDTGGGVISSSRIWARIQGGRYQYSNFSLGPHIIHLAKALGVTRLRI